MEQLSPTESTQKLDSLQDLSPVDRQRFEEFQKKGYEVLYHGKTGDDYIKFKKNAYGSETIPTDKDIVYMNYQKNGEGYVILLQKPKNTIELKLENQLNYLEKKA